MTDEVHTARPLRAGVAWRAALQWRPAQLAAVVAWVISIAGFAVYLVRIDALVDSYGGIGTGIVLLLWMTLFSVLYYTTPDLRVPAVVAHPRATETAGEGPSPLAARVERVVEPSAALRNTVAQGRMMSVLGARAAGMSEREADMMDWGFAFGVAWAMMHSQDPGAPEEVLSARALNATQAVYRAYRGSEVPAASAAHAHANGSRAPDARDLCA